MKSEYKSLKSELETHTTNRDKLEKEIRELTEKSQKLKKELRHMKGNLCDNKSILSDLIKISISMDTHADSIPELPSLTESTNEAISQFTGDLQVSNRLFTYSIRKNQNPIKILPPTLRKFFQNSRNIRIS